jgi:hypothetical protein
MELFYVVDVNAFVNYKLQEVSQIFKRGHRKIQGMFLMRSD